MRASPTAVTRASLDGGDAGAPIDAGSAPPTTCLSSEGEVVDADWSSFREPFSGGFRDASGALYLVYHTVNAVMAAPRSGGFIPSRIGLGHAPHVVDGASVPTVVYVEEPSSDAVVARRDSSGWTTTVLVPAVGELRGRPSGFATHMAAGRVWVAYVDDAESSHVVVARETDAGVTQAASTLANPVLDIAWDASGVLHALVQGPDSIELWRDDASGWTTEGVVGPAGSGTWARLAFSATGEVLALYTNPTGARLLSSRRAADAGPWMSTDLTADVGSYCLPLQVAGTADGTVHALCRGDGVVTYVRMDAAGRAISSRSAQWGDLIVDRGDWLGVVLQTGTLSSTRQLIYFACME